MSNAEETTTCNMNNEDENSADEGHSTDPVQKGEETIYEEVHAYLSRGCYPLSGSYQTGKWYHQRTKRKFDRPAPALHPIPVSDTWNKVGIDLITLPPTKNGNQYCITLTDYFSKWVEAAPMPTKEAKHVAEFLYKMILRHGCPLEIVSDQG